MSTAGEEVLTGLAAVWHGLGPFQTGMREQAYGANPLTPYGGIIRLHNDRKLGVPSSLVDGGLAVWKTFTTRNDGWTEVYYPEPEVRWKFLRRTAGWQALQFQTYLVSRLYVPADSDEKNCTGRTELPYLISLSQAGEFWIDGQRYTGDWYNYAKHEEASSNIHELAGDTYDFGCDSPDEVVISSSPGKAAHLIYLRPGHHEVVVRASYEIRIFGDVKDDDLRGPVVRFYFDARRVDREELHVLEGEDIVPEVIDRSLMGNYVSITLRNLTRSTAFIHHVSPGTMREGRTLRLESGQCRPLVLRLQEDTFQSAELLEDAVSIHLDLDVYFSLDSPIYNNKSVTNKWKSLTHRIVFPRRASNIFEPDKDGTFRYTFLVGDHLRTGFAIAKAPIAPSTETYHQETATVLFLHGAGVDILDPRWALRIPRQQYNWTVIVGGSTPWGYDWHGPSEQDALLAVSAPILRDTSAPAYKYTSIRPLSDAWINVGHSNGCQGTWHLMTRHPDNVVAGLMLAGYDKVQRYVGYDFWQSDAYVDPSLQSLLQSAFLDYDNDQYLCNLTGMPIVIRTGAADDNVPPYHSHRMYEVLTAWNAASGMPFGTHPDAVVKLKVDPDKGHWYDCILDDEFARSFFTRFAKGRPGQPERLNTTTLRGRVSRGGLSIVSAGHNSRIPEVSVRCTMLERQVLCKNVASYTNIALGTCSADYKSRRIPEHPRSVSAILQADKPLRIIYAEALGSRLASQISHDLYLYLGISSEVEVESRTLWSYMETGNPYMKTNLVLLGEHFMEKPPGYFDLLSVLSAPKLELGWVNLRPGYKEDKLYTLSIDGSSLQAIERAAQLFPIRAAVPVPDWVVISDRAQWQGSAGVVAAGFWNDQWELDPSSSYINFPRTL